MVALISGFPAKYLKSAPFWVITYTASSGKFLPTFRDNVSVPYSGLKNGIPLRMGPICCPETSVRIFHYSLRNNPEERSSQMVVSLYQNQVPLPPSLSPLFA